MPGLIDCHVHVYADEVDLRTLEPMPLTAAHRARGRRCCAACSIAASRRCATPAAPTGASRPAVEHGLIAGPRLFISGRPISQTGGHGDSRRRTDLRDRAAAATRMARTCWRIADGVDEVRKRGARARCARAPTRSRSWPRAASPRPTIRSTRCSSRAAEIAAAVDEATAFGRYVMAHAYTPEAITRAVEHGVRTIEHGNLIDDRGGEADGRRRRLHGGQPGRPISP